MDALVIGLCALTGLLIGVPMQLVVLRSPLHLRYVGLPSHCGNCGLHTRAAQRFSLPAIVTRSNACTNCNKQLWTRWPWIELTCAAVLGLAAARLGWAPALPAYLVFFAALVAITIVDLRHYLIPNRVIYPALFACLLLLLPAAFDSGFDQYIRALMGMAGAWIFFFIVWIASPRSLGFGDVRLSALNGLMTGWLGFGNVILGVLLGLLSAAGIGLVLLVTRIRGRKDPIPFGPFLALGAGLATLFAGTFT